MRICHASIYESGERGMVAGTPDGSVEVYSMKTDMDGENTYCAVSRVSFFIQVYLRK